MRKGFFVMIEQIIKRDGRTAPFELDKIANAIFGAAQSVGGQDYEMARELAEQVEQELEKTVSEKIPTVEQIQDTVETVLIESGHAREEVHPVPRRAHPRARNEYPPDEGL